MNFPRPRMNRLHAIALLLVIATCSRAFAELQDIDAELSDLAGRLTVPIKANGKKKVAVIDFTDLQGSPEGELGKYIAEQLTVDLVMSKRDFAVLDRANLRKILAEHKLTSEGLVDPDNAKKLGMFAGVDALILGTIIPKGDSAVSLTAKIITTDTAEIVGAARAEFKEDSMIKDLVSKPAPAARADSGGGFLPDDKPPVVKSFGDLRVEVRPLLIVDRNQLQMTITLTNQSPRNSTWVALSGEMFSIKAIINDSAGAEFRANRMSVSGIQVGTFARYGYTPNSFSPATEIRPRDAISATLRFASSRREVPAPGRCRIQLEILQGRNYDSAATDVSFDNFTADVEATQ